MGPVNALTGDCFENRIYENPVLTPPPVSPPALSPSLRSCFPCVISPLSPPPFFPNFYRIYTKKKHSSVVLNIIRVGLTVATFKNYFSM